MWYIATIAVPLALLILCIFGKDPMDELYDAIEDEPDDVDYTDHELHDFIHSEGRYRENINTLDALNTHDDNLNINSNRMRFNTRWIDTCCHKGDSIESISPEVSTNSKNSSSFFPNTREQ
jgi:hypothetical protein